MIYGRYEDGRDHSSRDERNGRDRTEKQHHPTSVHAK